MRAVTAFALVGAMFALGCSASPDAFPDVRRRADAADTDVAHDGAAEPPRDVPPVPRDAQDPAVTPDSACAAQTSETRRAPMNLLLVLDRSGSMRDGGKWDSAVRAIGSLIERLDDATRVGLVYFPARRNGDQESAYATPVVPVGPLATTREMIRASLASTSADGGTPMACAVPGAIAYYQGAFAEDGSRNLVLITDGEPTDECSGAMCSPWDFDCLAGATERAKLRIQAAVAAVARATPPIRTFVVGTAEADDRFLSAVAVNGNSRRAPGCESGHACHYSLGSASFETDLNRALEEIRGRAATCEFHITTDLSMADPNLVNVYYTPGGSAESRLIPRDASHSNGWDYSPDMRAVILHGPICDEVRGDTDGGRVQILFGCPTVTPG